MLIILGLATFCVTLLIPNLSLADRFDGWKSYTSTAEVRYVDYFEDSIQVVTSGGWLKIDPISGGLRKITNADGLGTNNLNFILKDDNDVVWVAGFGRLIKYENGLYTLFLFFDRDNNLLNLYTIEDDDDQLWIGTSAGLARFDKYTDGGQIEDFYTRFDSLSAEAAVKDIFLLGPTIFLATSDGLAMADRSDPNLLKSFVNWDLLKPSTYVTGSPDSVNALAYYYNKLYIGTSKDVFRIDIDTSAIPDDTVFADLITRSIINVKHMIITGDTLTIYASGGFFMHIDYTSLSTIWNPPSIFPSGNFTAGRFVNGTHWIGHLNSGIFYGADADYLAYDDGGLPGNLVTGLASDNNGHIAGAFHADGVSVFDGEHWLTPDFNMVGHGIESIVYDAHDNIWVGTGGSGATLIRDDTMITFDESNSSLHGVPDLTSYIVVKSLAAAGNYMFLNNFAPRDGKPIRVVDINNLSSWDSFGPTEGINDGLLYSLAASEAVFVTGTSDNGLFYYYYGSDPFNGIDDSLAVLRESNSWLGSDNVRTISYDFDEALWVGTKFGLSRYDLGIDKFVNVILPLEFGPEVNHLAFDRRGNIWMGATNGLARYDAGTGTIDIFTTLNSGLSDDNITALVINRQTNDLWVGTSEGVSVFESTIGPPTLNADDVIAFPNPFIIRNESDVLSFNYSGEATIRIYTVNGELVKKTDINIPWDGKNEAGREVAAGVYLFLMSAEDGSIGRGKIFLLRE